MTAWLDQKLEARGLERADLFIWPLGMAIAVLWALPFVWMVSTSFKFPGDVMTKDIEWLPHRITFDNYVKVFDYPVLRWGFNSVVQASVSTVLCVLFGAMAGYALARMRFPGRRIERFDSDRAEQHTKGVIRKELPSLAKNTGDVAQVGQ